MTKKQRVLAGINLSTATGIEVGALCRPLVTRADGPIFYVDHADTETLRRKYKGDPNVDLDSIVEVDAVWGSNTLAEALGGGRQVDYVVASHLIEHVPDFLGWLREVHTVLKPSGSLRLVIPDRRFTFDYMRQESRLSDVLYASLMQARAPLMPFLLDYVLEVVEFDAAVAQAASPGSPEQRRPGMRRLHDLDLALSVARDAHGNGTYHDAHCWVFTPASFATLMQRLTGLGLIGFSCQGFHDTVEGELDFIVAMEPCGDVVEAAESWRRMAEACAPLPQLVLPEAAAALPQIPAPSDSLQSELAELRVQHEKVQLALSAVSLQGDPAALKAEIEVLRLRHAEAVQALAQFQASRFWRATEPLRRAVSWWRGAPPTPADPTVLQGSANV